MKPKQTDSHTRRQTHFMQEHVHDPYRLRGKLPEPTHCPQCGATYLRGRWTWHESEPRGVHETLCQACRRVNDDYPAGMLTLSGGFVGTHRDEIAALVRNVEQRENAEHPLHRVMDIRDSDGATVIRTTDIHLPRAIGHALENAWQGRLETHYDEEGYFVRVEWTRDE